MRSLSLLSLLLIGLLTCLPAPGCAEDLIAAIVTGNLPQHQQAHRAFEKVLQQAGFDASKVKIFQQTPNPDKMSLTNSIRRSVMAGAKLLITYGDPAALIAKEEAREIPVLFADVYDPVAIGLVQTLATPGANRTGACTLTPAAPLLAALHQVVPAKARIGALFSTKSPGSELQISNLSQAASQSGLQVITVDTAKSENLEAALQPLANQVEVLFIAESPQLLAQLDRILQFAHDHKLPVISQTAGLSDAGVFLSYAANPTEQGNLIGVDALQILAGQKAFFLPVRQGKKFDLEINLPAATGLGLKVPNALLQSAAKVVR